MPLRGLGLLVSAERVGFEPTVPFNTVHSLSRRAPSAARAPLQFEHLKSGASALFPNLLSRSQEYASIAKVSGRKTATPSPLNFHDLDFLVFEHRVDFACVVVGQLL